MLQHGRTLKAKKPVSTYYIIICISNVQIRQNGTETDYQHAKQWNCVLSLQHTQKLTLNGSLPYTEENYDTHKVLRNWSLHPSLLEMWNGAAASGNSSGAPPCSPTPRRPLKGSENMVFAAECSQQHYSQEIKAGNSQVLINWWIHKMVVSAATNRKEVLIHTTA